MVRPRKSMEPWLLDQVEFYDHQIEGVRDLARRRSFLLADEMGLGKSLQALTVFIIDIMRGWGESCIVVCPVTLKGNWEEEIKKFTRIPVIVLGQEYDPKKKETVKLAPAKRAEQLIRFKNLTGPKIR
jgi:SNF2 family DNA or RNA helicase